VALSANGDTALRVERRRSRASATRLRLCVHPLGIDVDATGAGEPDTRFGESIALSPDETTAVIGAPADGGRGSVSVFMRSGSGWTQQGPKLRPIDQGQEEHDFGSPLAVSAVGDTVLVGSTFTSGAWSSPAREAHGPSRVRGSRQAIQTSAQRPRLGAIGRRAHPQQPQLVPRLRHRHGVIARRPQPAIGRRMTPAARSAGAAT